MSVASAQSSLIGATIGNYKVVAKLGEGGMGAVYLAEHPLIGKKVALKVLHDEYSANQDVVARFFNEAKAVNDIQHPNIVDIIDYGVVQTQTGPGFVYFIMEFLAGESLAQIIQREAPMAPERAFAICAQVADALAASHQKGIIHRDLKPDNIYLVTRGREKDFVKVLDFGIAKLTGDAPGSRRTRTGIVMGTPAYMSPEQCEGKGNIDARTDVYALGIVLYEMLTGRVPFGGEGYGEVLVQHLTKRPERPTTPRGLLPPYVEAVLMKTLEKKRDDRYQHMEDFIAALRDPQAYVDAHGGLEGFVQLDDGLGGVGSGVAMAPGQARTPYPRASTPGQGVSVGVLPTATPGQGMQRPGTLPGAAADPAFETPGGAAAGKKKMMIIGAAVVGVLAIGGLAFALGGGGGKKETPAPAPEVANNKAPEPPPEKPAEPPVKPVEPPPAPAVIRVSVATEPPGAEVFVGDEAEARGKSPIQLELPKGEGTVSLTVRAEGYKEAKRTIKLSLDAQLEIALAKDRRSGGAKPGGAAKPPREPKDPKPPKDPPKDPRKPGGDDVIAPSF